MRKNSLLIYPLMVVGSLFSACEKNEDVESIFYRNDGSLTVKVIGTDDQPLEGAEVRFYNYTTENEIDFEKTPENGTINFGRFKEGFYAVNIQAESGDDWFSISQETHILSGIDKVEEIRLKDFVGSVDILLKDQGTNAPIENNFNLEVALVPNNYKKLREIADAQDYLEHVYKTVELTDGRGVIENLPSASYMVFLVQNGKVVYQLNHLLIEKNQENFYSQHVPTANFRFTSKESWVLEEAMSSSQTSIDVPFTSLRFTDNNKIELQMEDGKVVKGSYYYYSPSTINFEWEYSSSYTIHSSIDGIVFTEDNKMIITWDYFEYYTNATSFSRNYFHTTFK